MRYSIVIGILLMLTGIVGAQSTLPVYVEECETPQMIGGKFINNGDTVYLAIEDSLGILLKKINVDGTSYWEKYISVNSMYSFNNILRMQDGNILLVESQAMNQVILTKFDDAGNLIDSRKYTFPDETFVRDADIDSMGRVVLTMSGKLNASMSNTNYCFGYLVINGAGSVVKFVTFELPTGYAGMTSVINADGIFSAGGNNYGGLEYMKLDTNLLEMWSGHLYDAQEPFTNAGIILPDVDKSYNIFGYHGNRNLYFHMDSTGTTSLMKDIDLNGYQVSNASVSPSGDIFLGGVYPCLASCRPIIMKTNNKGIVKWVTEFGATQFWVSNSTTTEVIRPNRILSLMFYQFYPNPNKALLALVDSSGINGCTNYIPYSFYPSSLASSVLTSTRATPSFPTMTAMSKIISSANTSFQTICTSNGMEDMSDDVITIFPVPASDVITVNTQKPIQKIDVLDMMGREVELIENANILSTSRWNEGVYCVKVQFMDGSFGSTRIIIKR